MPEEQLKLPTTRPLGTDAHRARAIVASLRGREPSGAEMFDAFWELDELPVDAVKDALTDWIGPLPDLDRLDDRTRLAHGLPLRPLKLRTLAVATDADVLDLGAVAEEQLRRAGQSWDGVDRAPEERLDGELEGSFAGTLERRVLGDAEAAGEKPLFDVLLFAEDAGAVFAAGETKVIGLVAYGKVEMRDRRARVAIEEALATATHRAPAIAAEPAVAARAPEGLTPSTLPIPVEPEPVQAAPVAEAAEPVAEPVEPLAAPPAPKAVAKKAATKKVAAKKAVAAKSEPKKVAAKKAVAAKPVAKKAAAKKVATKVVAAKKTVAKKVVAAKKTAKAPAAKAARKPAAKAAKSAAKPKRR